MTLCTLRTLLRLVLTVGIAATAACVSGAEEAPVAPEPLKGTLGGKTFAPSAALARPNGNGPRAGVEIFLFPGEVTCENIESAQQTHDRWVRAVTPGPLVAGEVWNVDMEHLDEGVRFAGRVYEEPGSAGRGRLEVVRASEDGVVVRMRAAWKAVASQPTEGEIEGEVLVKNCR
jgi:hypothetical protein